MSVKSYWPLSAFVDYITEVPFGPCAAGARVRLMSGGYGHYDNTYSYTFKRIFPTPEILFHETHPGEFQPGLYFLDFLKPVSPLPTIEPWPFLENSEHPVKVEHAILFDKKPILFRCLYRAGSAARNSL